MAIKQGKHHLQDNSISRGHKACPVLITCTKLWSVPAKCSRGNDSSIRGIEPWLRAWLGKMNRWDKEPPRSLVTTPDWHLNHSCRKSSPSKMVANLDMEQVLALVEKTAFIRPSRHSRISVLGQLFILGDLWRSVLLGRSICCESPLSQHDLYPGPTW
jgi:hypothetical protein